MQKCRRLRENAEAQLESTLDIYRVKHDFTVCNFLGLEPFKGTERQLRLKAVFSLQHGRDHIDSVDICSEEAQAALQ